MARHGKSVASTTQAVEAAQNAGKTHEWPEEAGECTAETWALYVKNQCFRAFDDWNDADLVELAKVSKIQALVFLELEKLETEGVIVYAGKSGLTPCENPRNRAISTLNSTITATMRRLGITASNSGDREAKANRGKQERRAEQYVGEPSEHPNRTSLI